ncbi:MAG: TIGR00725 family protein [Gemmatimonadetes bacterium]|nr:TIGR00725 family protein [Gemmatimonadota bacterium]
MRKLPKRPIRVAVIGAGDATELEYETARTLGRELALAGAVVVCGGRGGVMEGAARGAADAGGASVGILPGEETAAANPWITIPLASGLGHARNALVAGAGHVVLAVGGSWGTLSEIALARARGIEVGTLLEPPTHLGLPNFSEPAEAAAWAVECAREAGRP